jgi:hypothetical protein
MNPWTDIFPSEVSGVPIRDFVRKNILPRPRDLIYFVQHALEPAVNGSRTTVTPDDIEIGLKEYSGFAISQMISEYKTEHPWLRQVVSSFAGGRPEMSLQRLQHHLRSIDVSGTLSIREMTAQLVRVGFLGIVKGTGEPMYADSLNGGRTLAQKVMVHSRAKDVTLVIHPVYRRHLGIDAGDRISRRRTLLDILERAIGLSERRGIR